MDSDLKFLEQQLDSCLGIMHEHLMNMEPVYENRGQFLDEIVEFGLQTSDADTTRPGRITLNPTTEQTALVKGLTPGMTLLLDDGFMEIAVTERVSETEVKCVVKIGGNLKSRKGINVPQLQVRAAHRHRSRKYSIHSRSFFWSRRSCSPLFLPPFFKNRSTARHSP